MVDILLVNWKESWCDLWVEVREDTDSARSFMSEAVRFVCTSNELCGSAITTTAARPHLENSKIVRAFISGSKSSTLILELDEWDSRGCDTQSFISYSLYIHSGT
jgi:hypothetical protein